MHKIMRFIVFVKFGDANTCKRLGRYFSVNTRPNFSDEVLETETELVDVFEFLPYPTITPVDSRTLLLYFEDDSDNNVEFDDIVSAVSLFSPNLLLSYSDFGDDEWYERYRDGRLELVWAVMGLDDPEDDERMNRILSDETKARLRDVGDPARILQLLAKEFT